MPLISSSGYSRCLLRRRTRRAGRTSTRSICRPTAMLRTLTVETMAAATPSPVENVGAGGGAEHRERLAAEFGRCLLLPAAAFAKPGRVVGPPATGHRLRLLQPPARVGRDGGRGLERCLRVARRVDHGGDVPAGGQHEPG